MSESEILFDFSTINELKDILGDDLISIFEEFRTGTEKMINNIKTEHQADNIDAIIQLAHTIKGSAGNLGIKKIAELARTIEDNLRRERETDITAIIRQIETTYDETIKELITLNYLSE